MTDDRKLVTPDWLDVSRETFDRLSTFVAIVEKWTPAINLISKASVRHIWERHVLDSAQLFYMAPTGVTRWLDIGSGGGFPGLVVAILAQGESPQMHVTLVESDLRKSTFLAQAVRNLDLTSTILTQRIENLGQQSADVLSARALAPLTELCGFASRQLQPTGVALFPKGAKAKDEIVDARKSWNFDVTCHQSKTDAAATILAIRGVVHV